jgi:hypothetical protein
VLTITEVNSIEGELNGSSLFNSDEGVVVDGKWKDGKWDGFGKLYDSNGNILFDGKW